VKSKRDIPQATERRHNRADLAGRLKTIGDNLRPNEGINRSDYTDEETEFLKAIDTYKRVSGRPHPRWTEVLAVLKALGYRKVAGEG